MTINTSDIDTDALVMRRDQAGVATLILNRPAQYNALSDELLTALHNALNEVATDSSIQVVVLAANGKAFCAGHDLKQMRASPEQDYYKDLFTRCANVMQAITELPQPVIARVHGVATAAGCQLVASCDLAIASNNARFAVSGINVGLFCSTPSVALARNVGRKRAMEMLLTGEFIDAQQAADEGLINRTVPDDRLDTEITRLTNAICSKSPAAIQAGKQLFYRQLEMSMLEAYELAADTMSCNMMFEDTAEGIDAFMEKRPPSWKGR